MGCVLSSLLHSPTPHRPRTATKRVAAPWCKDFSGALSMVGSTSPLLAPARVPRATVILVAMAVLASSAVQGTVITVKNQCSTDVIAFARHGDSDTNKYILAANGGSQDLDVGPKWDAGLIWASPTGNTNNGQATQVEMTTNGYMGLDYYDISLVNAYNLGVAITPIGSSCQADTCSSIPDLQSFCQSPNVYADGYCINTAGPGLVSTASTQQFKSACPAAYSYSKDDSTSTVTCPTGVNYQVAFCP